MLKIWYHANIEYMKDAPSHFDNVYEDEWIEDSFVKEMIRMWIIAQLSVHILLTVLYWEP